MKSVLLFLSAFAFMTTFGCATAPVKRFEEIKPGMYKGDVLDAVGSPTESRYRGDQYVWTYRFLENDKNVVKEVHVKNDFVTYAGDPKPMASDSKIARVSTGMNKSQVLDIMGFPKRAVKDNGKDSWVYSSKNHGDAQVQFENDIVTFIGPAAEKTAASPAPAAVPAVVPAAAPSATPVAEEVKPTPSGFEEVQ
jgi:outer membrane protein assembly factor BamE (lipoprotein component of BamABCDE complex)